MHSEKLRGTARRRVKEEAVTDNSVCSLFWLGPATNEELEKEVAPTAQSVLTCRGGCGGRDLRHGKVAELEPLTLYTVVRLEDDQQVAARAVGGKVAGAEPSQLRRLLLVT